MTTEHQSLVKALRDIQAQLMEQLSQDERILEASKKRLAANKALVAEIQKQCVQAAGCTVED